MVARPIILKKKRIIFWTSCFWEITTKSNILILLEYSGILWTLDDRMNMKEKINYTKVHNICKKKNIIWVYTKWDWFRYSNSDEVALSITNEIIQFTFSSHNHFHTSGTKTTLLQPPTDPAVRAQHIKPTNSTWTNDWHKINWAHSLHQC